MNVEYSRQFVKAMEKLSKKSLEEVRFQIGEVKRLDRPEALKECQKLAALPSSFRIQAGSNHLLTTFQADSCTMIFHLMLPKEEVSSKAHELALKRREQNHSIGKNKHKWSVQSILKTLGRSMKFDRGN
jgi:hypothetical protein